MNGEHEEDAVGGDQVERELALRSLLSLHPQAPVSAVREDGIFIPMPESLAFTGHPVLTGVSALDFVVPQDRAAVIVAWDQVRATGSARCVVRLSGDENPAVFYAFDLRQLHGVLVIVFTGAGQAETAAAAGRTIARTLPKVASVSKDERATFLKIDEALTQILGWTADELQGSRSIELIHPDDHSVAIENWMEMLAAPGPGRRVRLRHKRRDGAWVWFEVTNHNLLDDREHGCVVTGMVDITEEMATHEALRAREELLDRLAEAIPVGLVQIDASRRVVYTNERLHQIVGVERSTTVKQQLSSVVKADRAVIAQAIDVVLGEGSPVDIEVELRLSVGGLRRCAISFRALSDEAGATNGAIACVTDVTESARMREELNERATFDELTGCYNRPSVMRALDAQLADHASAGALGVIFIDLDLFKQVNDRFGHACGNELLRIVAQRIRRAVRSHDIVGRIGGDEFLVMLPKVENPGEAMKLAQRLAGSLREDVHLGSATVANRASIGVACSTEGPIDAETLVARADSAMYQSKRQKTGQPRLAKAQTATPLPDA